MLCPQEAHDIPFVGMNARPGCLDKGHPWVFSPLGYELVTLGNALNQGEHVPSDLPPSGFSLCWRCLCVLVIAVVGAQLGMIRYHFLCIY